MYISTYIRMYTYLYIRTYYACIHTYVRTYVCFYSYILFSISSGGANYEHVVMITWLVMYLCTCTRVTVLECTTIHTVHMSIQIWVR